jgi:hypothetical protein
MFRKVQRLVKLSLLLKFQPSGCDSLTNQWVLSSVMPRDKSFLLAISPNNWLNPHPATIPLNPNTTTANPSHFAHFILISSFAGLPPAQMFV